MAEIRPQARFTRWIAAGLVACTLLLALRVGWPIYRRKLAIEKLQELGTVISTDFWADRSDGPRRAAWWKKAVPASWSPAFEEVISVRIEQRNGSFLHFARRASMPGHDSQSRARTRELLETLRQFRELQWLDLDGTSLEDEDLLVLADLKHLECLVLANTRINGVGLRHFSHSSKIKALDMSRTEIDDSALELVANLTSLESLRLDGTRISDAGVKHLSKLPHLRELSCSNTQVTETGIDALLKTHAELSVTDD